MGNGVSRKDDFLTLDEFAFRACMSELVSLKVANKSAALQNLEDAVKLKMQSRLRRNCPKLVFKECVRAVSEANVKLNLEPILDVEQKLQNMQTWHILQSSLELSSNARRRLDVLESKRRKISLWVLYAEILGEGPISSRCRPSVSSDTKPVSRYALSMRYPAADF
jgi:hypothetical protein